MVTKNKKIPFLLMIGILILAFASGLMARQNPADVSNQAFAKTAVDKYSRTLSNISNWSYWLYYDGKSANDPDGDSGGIYPRSTTGVIFIDGIVWGGYVMDGDTSKPALRVGGQTYNIGTTPGWIETAGDGVNPPVAVSADDPRARIYRIRQDYQSLTSVDKDGNVVYAASVKQDAAEVNFKSSDAVTEEDMQAVVQQYATDWKEWPVDLGAPYYDEDGNGSYDPVLVDGVPQIGLWDETTNSYSEYYDRPGVAGADQVVWFVVNDLTESRTLKLYGSPPMGIELQVTAWGYNQPNSTLGQMLFKKFKFINKSGFDIDSMFVAQWADPDLGNYSDDLGGCDVDLSLGFAYNGFRTDSQFDPFGLPPAAVGYDFFQGPMVDGVAGQDLNKNGVDDADDYAVFGLEKQGPGKINLPMTSFLYFAAGSAITDPDLGEYESTKRWYNMLNGFTPTPDLNAPTPYTVGNVKNGTPTLYPLSGDPFLGTGDIDGQGTNLPPGDRRIGLASGPFNMAPGDEQELVVAVVGGIIKQAGGDNRNAVAQLKLNDAYAQFLYDKLFAGVPSPPKAPVVTANTFDGNITFDWGSDAAGVAETERDDPILGFNFQGYNVYQLPSETSSKEQAKLVATYDVVDRVGIIRAKQFLPSFGDVVTVPVQYGTDSGIKRYLNVDHDYINDLPLYNGQTYYFAVTAYNYNPDPNVPEQSLESALTPIAVVPQPKAPGYSDGSATDEQITNAHSAGVSEQATLQINVVDPAKITGDDYKLFYEYWYYYMDVDGKWKRTAYPDSVAPVAKTGDVTPSTFSALAYTSPSVGTRDLKFILDLVSPDYDYSDGVSFTLPSGVTINSAETVVGNGDGNPHDAIIDEATNTVTWGSPDTTGFGPFSGGEVFTINVNTPTLPLDVDYIIFDDGWGFYFLANYGLPPGVVLFGTGTVTISEEAYAFKTVPTWNLEDVTTGEVKLAGQEHMYTSADATSAPIVDGFQIIVGGSYEAPMDFGSVTLTKLDGTTEDIGDQSANGVGVGSYGIYGWAASARSIDAEGHGTSDLNKLIQDYEVRMTGEFDTTVVGGVTQITVKDGTGSMAYLSGARGYSLADHPFNPSPGTDAPFMVRVPFEVWNVDDNIQININIYDRKGDPATGEFQAWNPHDRMYTNFINTPYSEDLATVEAGLDEQTWNLVWWTSEYAKGEKVYIKYANPIIIGTDEFTFSTDGLGEAYSEDKVAEDAGNVNVFPNPYYAYNPAEPDRFSRYVTFNHLTPTATIRIFDLAGTQVRKLEKDDPSQFLRWNLRNESDIPVASGIYIAHIDMPEAGKTKILKVFIVQAQEVLKYY